MNIINASPFSSRTAIVPKPSFRAANNAQKAEKILKNLSGNLFNGNLRLEDSLNLSKIMEDPKKNKLFLATLASLLTATAAKITELLTNDSEEEKETIIQNSDGDSLEISKKEDTQTKPNKKKKSNRASSTEKPKESNSIGFIKHNGPQNKIEKELETSINTTVNRFDLAQDKRNSLIELYNRFCGLNNKKISFGDSNQEIPNMQIAAIIVERLNSAKDISDIDKLIEESNTYTSEKKDIKIITIPDNIKIRSNLREKYKNFDENERANFDRFLANLESLSSKRQGTILQKLNQKFSDVLSQIVAIYESLPEDTTIFTYRQTFLSQINNNLLSIDAVKNWETDPNSKAFNFLEYNALISTNQPEEIIQNLAIFKKNNSTSEIYQDFYENKTTLFAPKTFISESFQSILQVFNALHPNNKPLNYIEKDYTIDDIDSEIKQNRNSYPYLSSYLKLKENSPLLNKGKMAMLLKIYNESELNKDLFTLHSYLRFLERFVMPEIKKDQDSTIYGNQIKRVYIQELMNFKERLKETLKRPIEIIEYSVENTDIKAPKILIPANQDKNYEITINNQGRIHTIF